MVDHTFLLHMVSFETFQVDQTAQKEARLLEADAHLALSATSRQKIQRAYQEER